MQQQLRQACGRYYSTVGSNHLLITMMTQAAVLMNDTSSDEKLTELAQMFMQLQTQRKQHAEAVSAELSRGKPLSAFFSNHNHINIQDGRAIKINCHHFKK